MDYSTRPVQVSDVNQAAHVFADFLCQAIKEGARNILEPVLDSVKEIEEKKCAFEPKVCACEACGVMGNDKRKITVSYLPEGDMESKDYTHICVEPQNQAPSALDVCALILAASKLLAESPHVEYNVIANDLLDTVDDYLAGVAIKSILGGAFYDEQ